MPFYDQDYGNIFKVLSSLTGGLPSGEWPGRILVHGGPVVHGSEDFPALASDSPRRCAIWPHCNDTAPIRSGGRLAGKTATEMMAAFRRFDPRMRGSVTFDNNTCFGRHTLLRGMLSATTYFCDAYANWQKGGVENANGRIRRWLPRETDFEKISEEDIQEIAMTLNLTPRTCLGYRSSVEAVLSELGRDARIRFA